LEKFKDHGVEKLLMLLPECSQKPPNLIAFIAIKERNKTASLNSFDIQAKVVGAERQMKITGLKDGEFCVTLHVS